MRPLVGLRVLDLSRLIPGPFATLVLADLGATVDKIEDAAGGDYLRHLPPHVGGQSSAFHLLNRGKRSAVVDLKHPAGKAAFERLTASYDVLFEQFRPGALSRLGLGHETLRALYPRLIICALTGYGQTGPLSQRAGHDINYLARAGLLGSQGPPEGAPQMPGFQLADVSGGMWCVIAILAALAERERTGQGQVLDIAMTDGVLGFAATSFGAALAGEEHPRGQSTLSGGIAPYGTYLSQDGYPLTLAALEPKFWMAFCTAVGIEAEMDAQLPGPHQAALKERLASVFRGRSRAAWEEFATKHDVMFAPAIQPGEATRDPHLASRELFFEIDTPGGPIPQFRTPVTPKGVQFSPAPRGGEHTRLIFRDAGFSDEEIEGLIQSGAARQA